MCWPARYRTAGRDRPVGEGRARRSKEDPADQKDEGAQEAPQPCAPQSRAPTSVQAAAHDDCPDKLMVMVNVTPWHAVGALMASPPCSW